MLRIVTYLKCFCALIVILSTVWFESIQAQSGSRSTPSYNPTPSQQYAPAQGSGSRSEPSREQAPRNKTVEKMETTAVASYDNQLWKYLQENRYQNWGPPAGVSDLAHASQSPHGDKVKVYANRLAIGRPGEFPHNSIIIKENYDVTEKQLSSITVMIKSQGFAPTSGDWYWIKYTPNGQAELVNGVPTSGKVSGCIDCHQSAKGNDFVFSND